MNGLQKAINRMRDSGISFTNDVLASHGFPVWIDKPCFWNDINGYYLTAEEYKFLSEKGSL